MKISASEKIEQRTKTKGNSNSSWLKQTIKFKTNLLLHCLVVLSLNLDAMIAQLHIITSNQNPFVPHLTMMICTSEVKDEQKNERGIINTFQFHGCQSALWVYHPPATHTTHVRYHYIEGTTSMNQQLNNGI